MKISTFRKIVGIGLEGLANGALFPLSRLFRRRSKSWVFGTGFGGFEGNSKYLFLWICCHRPDIDALWITNQAAVHEQLSGYGLPVAMKWSARGLWRTLTAGAAIYSSYPNDINTALMNGAVLVNLWHGVGIKGAEYLSLKGRRSLILRWSGNPLVRLFFLHRFIRPKIFLSTSSFMTAHFSNCFRYPREIFLEAGYPRLDPSSDKSLAEKARSTGRFDAIEALRASGHRLMVYMPTWRDTDRPFLHAAFPDLGHLNAVLKAAGCILLLKLHPNTPTESLDTSGEGSMIMRWPDGVDFYACMDSIDCLVTDYSSVLYDYIFSHDSGVVIYAFDEERYLKEDRDLAFPFDENILGVKAGDFSSFCAAITSGLAFSRLDQDRLDRLRQRFWGGSSAPSSPRIVEGVEAMLPPLVR